MNYIILNEKNSNTIKGLIIQELPPITKPSMRVSTTTLDGLDGDIQDKLGFSSYDKTISIGLHGDFDINEIIKFFNSQGNGVFSNEPDKYYKYSINSQIDFERLIKFRTAKVKLHVQPFKYLLNEKDLDETISNQTSIEVINKGFEKSKPIITLYGSGIVEFLLNGYAVFQVNIDEYITIDSLNEEAYKDKILKNRNMIGEFPLLEVGTNIITWTGTLNRIVVSPNSRWL